MCSIIHLNSDVRWCLTCNMPFNVHTHTPEMHLEASLRLTVLLKHMRTPDPTETTHLPPELQPLMERNPSSGWRPFLRGINLNLQTVLVFPRRQHRNVPVSKYVTTEVIWTFSHFWKELLGTRMMRLLSPSLWTGRKLWQNNELYRERTSPTILASTGLL